jgi:hypothetical protein
MRALVCALLLFAGCRTGEIPYSPDGGGIGSGGGSYDLSGALCISACNRCTAGACCGPTCCNAGEWCDSSSFTCHCGQGAGCGSGEMCASAGPVRPGGNGCGSICCGAGHPCPL